jgi:hypothetical protein
LIQSDHLLTIDVTDASADAARVHLRQRLAVLERRIAVAIPRASHGADQPLRGLYLSRDQACDLLETGPRLASAGYIEQVPLTGDLATLAERVGLDEVDIDIVVAALAPDIDSRFEKLFGFLHDDLTRRRASVGLVLELLGRPLDAAAERNRFAAGAALLRCGLLIVEELDRPFLSRPLRVPDHVASLLLGGIAVDPLLIPYLVPCIDIDSPQVGLLAAAFRAGSGLIHLVEGSGGAAVHLAFAAGWSCGHSSIIVDLSKAPTSDLDGLVTALLQHQALTGDGLIVRVVEDLAQRAPHSIERLASAPLPVALVGSSPWNPVWSASVPDAMSIPDLLHDESAAIWRSALSGTSVADNDVQLVSRSFRLTPEQISRAARAAILGRSPDHSTVDFAALAGGARAQSASALDRLARRLEPVAVWADLILPDDVLRLLHELPARVHWREQVMSDWGLARGWRGRGIAALFAGPSGTGKTTAAEVIAADLGYDIHVVDLSSVVDKYIGETEKKLEVIFTEAERTNTVLLFDEADAIFGKRSEVKDARDRYANIEVSYLLQRIERFSGLAILTTNLGANLDEAFTRRLDVVVDFPRPDVDARESIWRHEFRPTVPVDEIDFEFCAASFDLTGGNIRNVVITAAYQAAEAGRAVSMVDVVAAVQREYRKMGRLCLVSEFGRYAGLLR